MPEPTLLNSQQMAEFVARGVLRFDGVVPDVVNRQFLDDAGDIRKDPGESLMAAYGRFMATNAVPEVRPGTPLGDAYAPGSALRGLFNLPLVRGVLDSLLGPGPRVDHHFLHVTFPPAWYAGSGRPPASQHTHQDSTIDPRSTAFDVQVMYFPHAVSAEMGGTRYIPGTHLRVVSEAAVGRYQNIRGQQHVVCPAGTLLFLHHGVWHGGGMNQADVPRYMFKVRLNPSVPQVRLWDTSDLPEDLSRQRPIFWTKTPPDPTDPQATLMTPEPWFEADTGRLEFINRIRLWRHLLGDDRVDVDWWLSRLENLPD